MQFAKCLAFGLGAALLLSVGLAGQASAQDVSQTVTINEPNGFTGVCAAPCYSIEKTVDIWNPGNPGPGVCAANEYTYVYTLTHLGGSLASPGIPLTEFEAVVQFSLVSSAGTIAGAGIAPLSTFVGTLNIVTWAFPGTTSCPNCLNEGQVSDGLYICSTAAPGSSPDNVSTTALILDAPGECLVPTEAPVVGTPNPCTIGFWKNRSNEKKGTIKFFPGTDFDDVVTSALNLSMGVFTSATGAGCPNFDDLLCALESKGNRTTAERARQQLAATLLNLAAGDLFPDNEKCALFEENNITSNSCGSNLTVGTAVGTSKSGITSGVSSQEHDALECLDDINNEVGVIQ